MLKKTIAVICIAALLFTSCGKNNSKNSISTKNTPKTEQKNNEKNITSNNDSKTEETNNTSDKDSTTAESNNNSDNDSKTEETTDNSDNDSKTEETTDNSDNDSKTEKTTDNSDSNSKTEKTTDNSDNNSKTEETTDNSDNNSKTEETTDNSDNDSNTEETKNNSDNTSMTDETKGDEKPETPVSESLPQFSEMKDGEEYAIMKTTMGDIKIRFFPEYAPKTVENFVTHAKEDYYDGIIFHRVINDFMIQSGDPKGNGTGGKSIWGTYFEDEFTKELHNYRGALSMANAGPGTNGSQFFIVQAPIESEQIAAFMDTVIPQLEDIGDDYFPQGSIDKYKEIGGTPQLDFHHTVFGQIFEGMDVVDAIAAVNTGENNKPKEDIVIKDIVIETYKAE